jgi:hypothetical protein
MRKHLAVAAAAGPILLALASSAQAQLSISTATTAPVATATAVSSAPADIDIVAGGSVSPTAAGSAVTLNSNNNVSNAGGISFSNINGVNGILALGGFTGSITNTGTISITESYSAPVNQNTGISYGAFAQGNTRIGISLIGPGVLTGSITDTGAINVTGQNSQGVNLQAPITGAFLMQTSTPSTTTGAEPTVLRGTISVQGEQSTGILIGANSGVGGNVQLGTVTATGPGAQAVVINGNVGGGVDVLAALSSTGYRSSTRQTNPTLAGYYTADQLQQGGSALVIGGNVAHGVLISSPPVPADTTGLDTNNIGVPDNLQGVGSVTTYGSAPAVILGGVNANTTIGSVLGPTGNANGVGTVGPLGSFTIQGGISANGVFDTVTMPILPGPVPATAVQIGAQGGTINLTSGVAIQPLAAVTATSYQADATGFHLLSGATVNGFVNSGVISVNSSQTSTGTTGAVNVNGLLIESGANIPSFTNNSYLLANLSGTAGPGGNVTAINDRSGTLLNLNNTGVITALLTQTLTSAPMPGTAVAVNMGSGTNNGPQTLTQSVNASVSGLTAYDSTVAYAVGQKVTFTGVAYEAVVATSANYDPINYSSYWRIIGATSPSITGSVLFGNGGTTLNVYAGSIAGDVIDLGAGVNTLNINGVSGQTVSVSGALMDEGGHLSLNVINGTLSDLNPTSVNANTVNIGATGVLLISADPANGTNTNFTVSGAATVTTGAQFGLTLKSVQLAQSQNYVVIQTVPGQGTLTAGSVGLTAANNAPFLYAASASVITAANPATQSSEVVLTVTRRSSSDLGLNAEEAAALDPILTNLGGANGRADPKLVSGILSPTNLADFRTNYDQLLPNQSQGIFEALDGATRSISHLVAQEPDVGARVAGSSLWLQEVNQRVNRDGVQSQASDAKLFGLVAGLELTSRRSGLGFTFAYLNDNEQDFYAPVGAQVSSSMVELGAYYRQSIGKLAFSVRGGGGYAWFHGERRFVTTSVAEEALADWNGYFADGHGALSYESRWGHYYFRPELSVDYLMMHQGASQESGATSAFDLYLAPRTSTRLSGQAVMVIGKQWGLPSNYFRAEFRGGYRENLSGAIGDTVASFSGGSPFVLTPDQLKGGWVTFGLSLKGGTPYSFLALEGDADMRSGEYGYDIRLAGRSVF